MATSRICSIDGCGKPVKARGWCKAHHLRFLRHGSPTAGGPMRNHNHGPVCSIKGCGNKHIAKGLCQAHYTRKSRSGSAQATKPLRTSPGEQLSFFARALRSDTDECILWPHQKTKDGYGRLWLFGRPVFAARAICAQTRGAPPDESWHSAHSCNQRACINPRHISWKSPSENMADKVEHGTHQVGEVNPHAKLTEEQVLEMRRLRPSHSLSQLADIFEVTPTTVSRIVRRLGWTHI